jgi:hypothetical protein
VPNPALTSPATLAMFEFVGKLMGIALRMKSFLPFRFPSMVRALVCTLAVPLLCPCCALVLCACCALAVPFLCPCCALDARLLRACCALSSSAVLYPVLPPCEAPCRPLSLPVVLRDHWIPPVMKCRSHSSNPPPSVPITMFGADLEAVGAPGPRVVGSGCRGCELRSVPVPPQGSRGVARGACV